MRLSLWFRVVARAARCRFKRLLVDKPQSLWQIVQRVMMLTSGDLFYLLMLSDVVVVAVPVSVQAGFELVGVFGFYHFFWQAVPVVYGSY